jgi:hypothetical protein
MAAGEDEPQPVVLDAFRISIGFRGQGFDVFDMLVQRFVARTAANRIDRFETSGGNQPCTRIVRHAVARPLLERRAERLAQRFLGEVEVPEQAYECREHPP